MHYLFQDNNMHRLFPLVMPSGATSKGSADQLDPLMVNLPVDQCTEQCSSYPAECFLMGSIRMLRSKSVELDRWTDLPCMSAQGRFLLVQLRCRSEREEPIIPSAGIGMLKRPYCIFIASLVDL